MDGVLVGLAVTDGVNVNVGGGKVIVGSTMCGVPAATCVEIWLVSAWLVIVMGSLVST